MRPFVVVASGLLVAGLGSCSFLEMSDRPNQAKELVSWVERVHVETEVAQQQMHTALRMLNDLASSNYEGSAVSAYARFVTALEECEKQTEKLQDAVEPMKASADPVFEQWNNDLEQFTSPVMRQRSRDRMARTREQFDAVVASVDPAQTALATFNHGLRDHALFLGNDLNPASIRMVQEDVRHLELLAKQLDGRFEHGLEAARNYVNMNSLPTGVEARPAAQPGGESQPQGPRR